MFLKEALDDKLKRSISEYYTLPEENSSPSHHFKKKPSKFQLVQFRIDKLKFSPKNRKNTEDILKNTKFNLNFVYDHKKFNDDEITSNV
jgi:hypothetical protein